MPSAWSVLDIRESRAAMLHRMSDASTPLSLFDSKRNLQKRIRCTHARCRAAHLRFSEFLPGPVKRYVQNDAFRIAFLQVEPDTTGEAYVMAHCLVCGNAWRVRGLSSLRELQYAAIANDPDVSGAAGAGGEQNDRVKSVRQAG